MKLLKNQSGQGMTEYIIIVALIAIAAIAAFAYFGQTVRHQTAAMSESLAGKEDDAKSEVDAAGDSAGKATTDATEVKKLGDYVEDKGQ